MRNIKLIIEYNGKSFNGWQKQPNKLNIQGEIEKAIEELTGEEVELIASGRTDAGVHSFGQTANFKTNNETIEIEARDVRVKISNVDIPVPYGSAFEGEIIRKGDMKIEADGSRMDCFELVQSKPLAEVEDHRIEVFGDDFDKYEDGTKISMAIIAEVAGKNMQTDFESVMERKFHAFINCAEGIMHTGQRDMIRIRVQGCI